MISVFRELWAYRELAIVLTWRELVVRYKRSVLGVLWALAEPAVMIGVYVVVFGEVLDAGGGHFRNYAVFAMFGVLAWAFFSTSVERCSTTFIEYTAFYRKVYFPRELFIAAVLTSRITTLAAGLVLAVAVTALVPEWREVAAWERLAWLPIGIVGFSLITVGLGLVVAGVNVLFRDTAFIVRFGLRLLFYACPIVYPLARVPSRAQEFLEFNPLVPLLWTFQGFADPRLAPPSLAANVSALIVTVAIALGGWAVFRRLQWRVADML